MRSIYIRLIARRDCPPHEISISIARCWGDDKFIFIPTRLLSHALFHLYRQCHFIDAFATIPSSAVHLLCTRRLAAALMPLSDQPEALCLPRSAHTARRDAGYRHY
jgi:hypothetical protein